MCASCRTPEGKIIAIGSHIKRVGTYSETLGVLVQCQVCGNYYLVDSFSPLIEEVNNQWVEDHTKDIKLTK